MVIMVNVLLNLMTRDNCVCTICIVYDYLYLIVAFYRPQAQHADYKYISVPIKQRVHIKKKKCADQKKKELEVKNMKYEITSTTYLISRMVFLLWNASFEYLASCNWEVGLLFDMIKAHSSKFLHTHVYD